MPIDTASDTTIEMIRDSLNALIHKLQSQAPPLWHIPKIRHVFSTRYGRHYHFFPELFVQVHGISHMHFPDETLVVQPGEILLVPRGMPHHEAFEALDRPFLNLVFMYGRRHVHVHAGQRQEGFPYPVGDQDIALPCVPADDPVRYLNDILTFSRSDSADLQPVMQGLFLAHFGALLHSLNLQPPIPESTSAKVAQCRHLVHQQLSDPTLCVKRLAAHIQCSADYLSHCFHTETGMRLSRYIHAERVKQAQVLMRDSELNISEIAYACGYRDPGHFSRSFRCITGHAPRAWRRNPQPDDARG